MGEYRTEHGFPPRCSHRRTPNGEQQQKPGQRASIALVANGECAQERKAKGEPHDHLRRAQLPSVGGVRRPHARVTFGALHIPLQFAKAIALVWLKQHGAISAVVRAGDRQSSLKSKVDAGARI
jgi:hypothetical protein